MRGVFLLAPFALAAFMALQLAGRSRPAASGPRRDPGFALEWVELTPRAEAAATVAVRAAWQPGGGAGGLLRMEDAEAVFARSMDRGVRALERRIPVQGGPAASDYVPDTLAPPTAAAPAPPAFARGEVAVESSSAGFSRASMLEFDGLRPFKKGNRTDD